MTPDLSARVKDAPDPAPARGPREAPAPAPLLLPCPECGAEEAAIDVKLGQLDCEQFSCCECGVEFSIESVEAKIAKWQKVIAWVKAAPKPDAE